MYLEVGSRQSAVGSRQSAVGSRVRQALTAEGWPLSPHPVSMCE